MHITERFSCVQLCNAPHNMWSVLFRLWNAFVSLLGFGNAEREHCTKPVTTRARKTMHSSEVYKYAKTKVTENSIVGRHKKKSCHALMQHDKSNRNIEEKGIALPDDFSTRCYGCGKQTKTIHNVYIYCCYDCGHQFQTMRHFKSNLGHRVALVVGGRTKLGHQVAMKLLEAGASVFVTTRFAESALALFKGYPHYAKFRNRLFIFAPLDLNVTGGLENGAAAKLYQTIDEQFGRLDILVNCAAQTIRCRDHQTEEDRETSEQKNRYGDALFVDSHHSNSWSLKFEQVSEEELREVMTVNAISIAVLTKTLLPLLRKSTTSPFIVNVHAREGLMNVCKGSGHYHTNMAKSALHMLTRMLIENNLTTEQGNRFNVHGVCPGWFSTDEYYENGCPFPCAPVDEIDAAARICHVIFENLRSHRQTRRHFTQFAT